MTFTTRVEKIETSDCTLFMVKVRTGPDYKGAEHDRTVHALTEETAAVEALQYVYGNAAMEGTAKADSEPDTSLEDPVDHDAPQA